MSIFGNNTCIGCPTDYSAIYIIEILIRIKASAKWVNALSESLCYIVTLHCVVADRTINHEHPSMHVTPQQLNISAHIPLSSAARWGFNTHAHRAPIIIHQQPIAQAWVRCEIQAGEDQKHRASFIMHQLDGWHCVNKQSSMHVKGWAI